jgi:hypothetical protein
MTVDPTSASSASAGLIDRVKNVLLTPQAEFDRIANEPADVNKIYMGYVLPLVALAAICGFIGMSFIGVSVMGFSYKAPLVAGLVGAVLRIATGLAGVYILAMIANALAPSFGSQQDMGKAHQLAAYGSTASFLAGIFAIVPALSMLGILGLYSLVLYYVGLPRLMKTPDDKRIGYVATLIVIAIVVWIVIGVLVSAVLGALGMGIGAGMMRPAGY